MVALEPGDLVKVRREEQVSVVIAPTTRPPDCELPEDLPDVTVCCVPIALIRTPADDETGVLRWVELADLAHVEDLEAELYNPASRPASPQYFNGPSGFVPAHSRAPGPADPSH